MLRPRAVPADAAGPVRRTGSPGDRSTRPADAPADARRPSTTPDAAADADAVALHVRNYDVARPHSLGVAVRGAGRDLERTYRLEAGQFRSEPALLPPGTYEVTVDLGTRGGRSTRRLAADAADALLVHVGGDSVTVTAGAY